MRSRAPPLIWAAWIVTLVAFFAASVVYAQPEITPEAPEPGALVRTAIDAADHAAGATNAGHLAEENGRELLLRAATVATESKASSSAAEEKARERERRALAKLAEARDREEAVEDEALRELRSRERELAELALQQTRDHSALLSEIFRETRENLDELAERKGQLLDTLDAIPPDVSAQRRRDEIDPLFNQILELRSEAHERFQDALDGAREAAAVLEQRSDEVAAARAQLDRARARFAELESELWQRRVALAEARLEHAELRELHQQEIVAAHRDRVRDYHSQFGFFAGSIEPMLERISGERRSDYFDLGDSKNWDMAVEALSTGVRALDARVEHRLEQLDASGLGTLEFWAWLWRLVYSLVGILLLTYIAIRAAIWGLDALCEGLLRRRLLRRKATVLVKLSEILRAVSRPTLYYVGIAYVADYAARSIPELLGIAWVVDAVFIYWLVMQASRVAILPRSERRAEGEVSAEGLEYLDETRAENVADIIGVDLSRARKLLNSIRVITVFWLFAIYLPEFLKPLTGITVLWWLVDTAATWGFIVIVYWVLSSWRDEIAALFEKLAGERLAPAVEFVNHHKARPWGVLIIAVTSLYVLVKEIIIVVRRYALETNVFKQLNALAFRTQIELQNRERADAVGLRPDASLEVDYLRYYEERPLDDQPFAIERTPELARVGVRFEAWSQEKRRGSVAIVGEAGIGKTTLLNQIERKLADEPHELVRARFADRITNRSALHSFVAELFEIDEVPEATTDLIAAICEAESRIVIVDDCHFAFGRHIEQFEAIDALLDIVHLCDGHHFFVLAFARHAWKYIDRVESRGHCFGEVITLEPWSIEDLKTMIGRRNDASGYSVSFANLVAAHADDTTAEDSFDVIETARGYFGYLHQFSGGIPRVAIVYWLASLHPSDRDKVLEVDLFERPDKDLFSRFSDDHWLMLAALVQHGALSAFELAEILDRRPGLCERSLDYFAEHDLVTTDVDTGRARVRADYYVLILRRLRSSKFLFGG